MILIDGKLEEESPKQGFYEGEICNIDRCKGIIVYDESPKEGCYCRNTDPPCSVCTTNVYYCPLCDEKRLDFN